MIKKVLLLLSTISSLNATDNNNFLKHLESFKKKNNAREPSLVTKRILESAIANCGIPKDTIILEADISQSLIMHGQPIITIASTSQMHEDQLTMDAYHECGHIFYEHNKISTEAIKSKVIINRCSWAAGISAVALRFFGAIKTRHLALGAGSYLLMTLCMGYQTQKASRLREFQADNFAYEKLLANNRADIILGWIMDCIDISKKQGYTKSTPFDSHPSCFERAENAVVFLRSKNLSLTSESFPMLKDVEESLVNALSLINQTFPSKI